MSPEKWDNDMRGRQSPAARRLDLFRRDAFQARSEFGARMAFLRSFGSGGSSDVIGYDPHRLTNPQVFVLSMIIFLAIVAFAAAGLLSLRLVMAIARSGHL